MVEDIAAVERSRWENDVGEDNIVIDDDGGVVVIGVFAVAAAVAAEVMSVVVSECNKAITEAIAKG